MYKICHFNKNKRAFSILEMIIVLMIMSLMGVIILAAQKMIFQSQNRIVISELKTIQTSVYLFNLIFGGLPGDYQYPAKISPNMPCVQSTPTEITGIDYKGDGDGMISSSPYKGYSQATATTPILYRSVAETFFVWCHLYMAGLDMGGVYIPPVYIYNVDKSFWGQELWRGVINGPGSKLVGGFYNIYYDPLYFNANIIKLYGLGYSTNFYDTYDISLDGNTRGLLSPLQAQDILSKMDNGLADSGNLIFKDSGGTIGQCIDTSDASKINLAATGKCVLFYKAW